MKTVIFVLSILLILGATVEFVVPMLLTPNRIKEMKLSTEDAGPVEGSVTYDVVYKKRLLRRDLSMDIYHPLAEAQQAGHTGAPVIVFFHGGSWLHGDKSMIRIIDSFLHKLRSRGIAVVSVNYTAGVFGGLRAPVENCRWAVEWLGDHGTEFNIDTHNLGLYGVSAGGHLALMCVPSVLKDGDVTLRYVLDEYGPTDLVAMAQGDAFSYSKSFRFFSDSVLKRYSPVNLVTSEWPPVLMFHGDADRTVSIAQTQELVRVLEKHGVPHEFHVVPGGDHGFFNKAVQEWGEMEDSCLEYILPLVYPGDTGRHNAE